MILCSLRMPRRLGLAAALWSAMAAVAGAQVVDHRTTFTGQTDLQFNGNASVTAGGLAQLTPAVNNQAGTFYTKVQVPVDKFVTRFVFHTLGAAGNMADGLGFCIQRAGNTAVGGTGGAMGYAGILTSVFIKFDNYPNVSTTRLLQNGAAPDDTLSTDMRPNADLHSQHNFQVDMTYNGTAIAMNVTDLTNNTIFSTSFTVDIPTVIGGATAFVGFTGGTGGLNANQEIVSWTYAYLPTPTNLTATNGQNQVSLSWGASAGATSYTILRSPTTGGPYTPLPGGTTSGTTFTDLTALNPNTYFYVVQATEGAHLSVYSNEAVGVPLAPPVSALPNTGLQTNESGAPTQFDIKFNQPAAAGVVVTVSSNNLAEGVVSTTFTGGAAPPTATATGFTVPIIAGTSPTITVIVTGVDDALVDGNIAYTVSVSASNMGVIIPDVQLTNNDNDVAGITLSRTAGLVTSENLTTDSFTVVLNKKPFGNVTMTLASTNMAEGTVFPLTVVLSPTDYNLANQHIVTVTGVDDALLDFTQPYTIITNPLTFSDPRDANAFALAGATNPPDVACVNVDNEAIPALDHVWGKGGCGLTGLEVVLLLGAGAAWRRRRR